MPRFRLRVILQGSWNHATVALADVKLPASVYAEKEGTFTNFQGRVQRIHAAIAPIGESLPDLDIITLLAVELGVPVNMPPTEAFEDIAQRVGAFSGLTYSTVGNSGQLLKQESGE